MTTLTRGRTRGATARPALLTGLLLAGLTLTGCGGLPDLRPGDVDEKRNTTPVAVVGTADGTDAADSAGAGTGADIGSVTRPLLPGALGGPFGSASYGHLDVAITEAVVSDLGIDQWGRADAVVDDPDARYLYVKLTITNRDPNDVVAFSDTGVALLAGDNPPVAAQRVNPEGDFAQSIPKQDTRTREYGFALTDDTSADLMRLRVSSDTVPAVLPLRAPETPAADAYPLSAPRPGAVVFNGALQSGCSVRWTVTTRKAGLTLDLPARLGSREGAAVTNRAPAGSRWLVLDAVVTTGSAKGGASCRASSQGVLSQDSFRLVRGGKAFAPVVAPLETLTARQSVTTQLVWEVPAGTTDVALRGLSPHGADAQRRFTLPSMPAMPGE